MRSFQFLSNSSRVKAKPFKTKCEKEGRGGEGEGREGEESSLQSNIRRHLYRFLQGFSTWFKELASVQQPNIPTASFTVARDASQHTHSMPRVHRSGSSERNYISRFMT